jgi:hypothetical protein
MKVLSFDVGIKNLAACILEWTDGNNIKTNLNIHYWDIINLVQSKKEADEISYCCSNKGCSTKPKSYIEFNDNKYCFCTKHLAKKDELMSELIGPYLEDKWVQLKNVQCTKCSEDSIVNKTEPNQIETKPTKSNSGSRKTFYSNAYLDLILCSKHYKPLVDKATNATKKVHPFKNKKVKDMSSNDLKLQLIKCLDQRANIILPNTEIVLIENQPTFKNPTMKAISDTLYTWFIIRGIVDGEKNNSSIKEVRFISPSNKLKEFDTKLITEADESKKYKITKKLSVDNTKTILTSYGLNKWLERILSFEKKDDLADSFLQGWYVLNNMFENRLYDQWQQLYSETIIEVADEVEIKVAKAKSKSKSTKTDDVLDLRSNTELEIISKESKVSKVSKAKKNKKESIKEVNLTNTVQNI